MLPFFVVLLLTSEVWTQRTKSPFTWPDPTCVCDPLCEGEDTCGDDPGGSPVWPVPRTDCNCCPVCPVIREGAECHPDTRPCDVTRRLECQEGICKGSDVPLCDFEGSVYTVGQRYQSKDCSLRCTCMRNGTTVCGPLECRRGFHKKGSFADDPACHERSEDPNNACCVLIVCSATIDEEEAEEPRLQGHNHAASERPRIPSTPVLEDDGVEESGKETPEGQKFVTAQGDVIVSPSKQQVPESIEDAESEAGSKDQKLVTSDGGVITSPPKSPPRIPQPAGIEDDGLDEGPDRVTPEGQLFIDVHGQVLPSPRPLKLTPNIELLQITPQTIQVQFPGITGGNLMFVEERLYRPPEDSPGVHRETPWENKLILEGNKIFTLTGLRPGATYRLRWQAPEKQYPDVIVSSKTLEEKIPKVILTGKTHDSVTVSFDHFAPNGYDYGYVAMFKESEGGHWQSMEQSVNSSDLPSMTLTGLNPDTGYIVRVAIYKDYETRTLGKSTGVIEVRTAKGCIHENASYAVGDFTLGCDHKCNCNKEGKVTCGSRCQPPLHRSGTWADDPLCVEQFVDDCCVLITCAGNAEGKGQQGPCKGIKCGPNAECRHEVFRGDAAETLCVCTEGFTGDPDDHTQGCKKSDEKSLGPSGSSGGGGDGRVGDGDGGGSNGVRRPAAASGGEGWPKAATDGEGSKAAGCQVKNETYSVGQEWFEGCEHKCQCSQALEILCQPRCKVPPSGGLVEQCELRSDPNDSCCQVMFCPDPNDLSGLKPVGLLPFDGCLFKNETYNKGQRFYDGCEQQCQCMGYGDMVCISRCPPTAFAPGQNCYTLPDASDPCCNITVCDEPFLDPEKNVKKKQDPGNDTAWNPPDGLEASSAEKRPRKEEGPEEGRLLLGTFTGYHHGVSGSVYALNETALVIKNFTYDGQGPDAFFWAGIDTPRPSHSGLLLAYPFSGHHFEYDSREAPVLGAFDGTEDVVLILPDAVSPGQLKWLSVWCRAFTVNFGDIIFHSAEDEEEVGPEDGCVYKGQVYAFEDEFYDGCQQYCVCAQSQGDVLCHEIKCPSKFGLDVINPFCLEWDEHPDFEPETPVCCPPVPVCLSDGSCHYKGQKFNNYDNIPMNLTGCEQRCYCEKGEVLCQEACYDLAKEPPGYLSCSPEKAVHVPQEDRPCCMQWGCPEVVEEDIPSRLSSVSSQALNETSVQFTIRVPRRLDGLKGFYQVFYTNGLSGHPDPEQWPTRVITPPGGKLSVSSDDLATLILSQLQPNQQYFLKVEMHVSKEEEEEVVIPSDILSANTPSVSTTETPAASIHHVDVGLSVSDVTKDSAAIRWRFFTPDEKKYVDGVQIRFTELRSGAPASGVPGTSPFIHRDTNFFTLEELLPDTEYLVDLYLIPTQGATIELVAEEPVSFRTNQPSKDPFDFTPTLTASEVSGSGLTLTWVGVPTPQSKFVSLFRVIYSEYHVNVLEEAQNVYVEPRDDNHNPRVRLERLHRATRYQIWLEAYLRNGKIAKSNVIVVDTENNNGLEDHSVMASPSEAGNSDQSQDSYYTSMMLAWIISAFALVALVIVTVLYLRRTTTYKAIISGGSGRTAAAGGDRRRSKSQKPLESPPGSSLSTTTVSTVNETNSIEMNGMNNGKKS